MQFQEVDASAMSSKRAPWHIFLFILAVFWMATPYKFDYGKHMKAILETLDTSMIISSVKEGSINRRLAILSLFAFSTICLFRRGLHGLRPIGLMGYLILFYICWVIMSVLWAEVPLLTARRVMVFLILILSAFSLAAKLSLKDITFLTFFVSVTTLLVSIGAELNAGIFHPLRADYRFAGVIHPVDQGWNCGLVAISSVLILRFMKTHRNVFRMTFVVGLIFLILM